MSEEVLLSWSSGKDSVMALDALRSEGLTVKALLTVLEANQKVSVHGVPRSILRIQADSLGLDLEEIVLNEGDSYEEVVGDELSKWKEKGIKRIAYGDLFLEDIRTWRDQFHKKFGLECMYPVWNHETSSFAKYFFRKGYKAVVTCVDVDRLDVSFAGRDYDRSFLADLPETIDPCGENGEFHTFVYDGPLFRYEVPFRRTEPRIREFVAPGHRFRFGDCELIEI